MLKHFVVDTVVCPTEEPLLRRRMKSYTYRSVVTHSPQLLVSYKNGFRSRKPQGHYPRSCLFPRRCYIQCLIHGHTRCSFFLVPNYVTSYELKYISPNSCVGVLTPSTTGVTVFGDRASKEVIKVTGGHHGGGPYSNATSVLTGRGD